MPLALAQPNGRAEPLVHINAKKRRVNLQEVGFSLVARRFVEENRVNLPLEAAVR